MKIVCISSVVHCVEEAFDVTCRVTQTEMGRREMNSRMVVVVVGPSLIEDRNILRKDTLVEFSKQLQCLGERIGTKRNRQEWSWKPLVQGAYRPVEANEETNESKCKYAKERKRKSAKERAQKSAKRT